MADFDDVIAILSRLTVSRTPGLQYVAVGPDATLVDYAAGQADLATGRPVRADTTLMAYSMSKTLTAAAVLQLVGDGRVGLDDGIDRYVEWQPYGREVTVRRLLSHTAGLPNPIPLRWVHPVGSHDTFDERATLDAVLRAHPRLASTPGTRFAYSNIGYWLLGPVVERASGEPFTSYVTTHVLEPLGLRPDEMGYAIADPGRQASGYLERFSAMNLVKGWLLDRQLIGATSGRWVRILGHYVNGPAFGGLVGTARGFARFLQDQLRPTSRILGGGARALFYEAQRTSRGEVAMTLGWHVGVLDGARYYFKEGGGGGFHCMMRVYPDAALATVVMTNATAPDVTGVLDATDTAVRNRRR